jgi:hypothetical protein
LIGLLDDAALLSLEHQLHLAEILGEHSWRCDLSGGRLEFIGAGVSVVCTDFHLLGTAVPDAGSWLWSWANPYSFPDEITSVAEWVRYFGVQHDIAELVTAELPFTGLPQHVPAEPHYVVGALTEAAKIISGRWSGYTAVIAAGGARAAFLVEHPDFRLPPPDPHRIAAVLTRAMTEVVLFDHRRAVQSYLRRRMLTVVFDDARRELTFTGPTVTGQVTFDEHGRLHGLAAHPVPN